MNRKLTILCLMAGLSLVTMAQTSRTELRAHLDLASGNYCNYPNPTGRVTPAPSGYEPFYVSHYGRHGARYMTDDNHYKYTIAKMDTAKALGLLTPFGEEILQKLNIARKWLMDDWGIDLDAIREEVQWRQRNYNMEELRQQIANMGN